MRALLVLTLMLAFAAPVHAQQQPASLPDIEDEVMCIECGTVLSVSNAPVAQQERQFIRDEIAAGKTKEQIKAAMVEQYGDDVIADPKTPWLWIVPVALALLAAIGVGFALRTWRGRAPTQEPELPPELSPEDARRLDAELSR
jgi:cytochrome c-type biogenesis protein CcmH